VAGAIAVLWALVAAAPAVPDTTPTLGSNPPEFLIGNPDTSPICTPGGTSTVSFAVSGTVQSGPFYPGIVTASGSYTIDVQSLTGGSSSNDFPVGNVLAYSETFTITSGSTSVTGTTQLATPPPGFTSTGGPLNTGACTSFTGATLGSVSGADGALNEAQLYLSYQAQIHIDGGEIDDSGNSLLSVNEQSVSASSIGPFTAGSFTQSFLNGLGTVITPPETGSSTQTTPAGGGTITTDPANIGATVDVPLQTSLTVPAGSDSQTISITAQPTTGTAPAGFSFFGDQILIDNGGITTNPSTPYVVTFTVDNSLLGGTAPSDVQVLRDGVPIGSCTDATSATPDPCTVGAPTATADGDALVTVRTTHFSKWNFAKHTYLFTGFLQPVDNLPALNSTKAGSAIPVKFALGGNQGLNIFSGGYPAQNTLNCQSSAPVDPIEQTVTAGSSSLSYDAVSGTYTYVWKTDKAWAGTCRELTLKFNDGTTRKADFKFLK
jgi:hypothetical protein